MFLNGLVQRLNGLMFEIKQSSEKEQQLNAEADIAEDSRKASSHLRAIARRERECRDALYEEWCAELQTIKACQAAIEKNDDQNRLDSVLIPARSDFDPDTIDLTFKHVHQFELVQNIVVTAHLIPETQLDLPPGAEETRDNALYRILHHNQLDDLIFRIDKNVARRAFDTLGDLLIARTEDQSQLQSIIDGAILFKDVPALQGAGEQLRLTDEDRSALRKLVVKFTSNAELREFNLICDNVRVKMRGGSGAALISKDELTLLRSLAQIKSPDS